MLKAVAPWRLRVSWPLLILLYVLLGLWLWSHEGLDQEESSAHIRFLASDELQGRRTGTAGGAAAARYIAEQFRRYGANSPLLPTEYLQSVPLVEKGEPAWARVEWETHQSQLGEELLVAASEGFEFTGPAVYVEQDALLAGDLVLTGKIVVTSELRGGEQRRAAAQRAGAAGLIDLVTGPPERFQTLWGFVSRNRERPRLELDTGQGGLPHLVLADPQNLLLDRLQQPDSVEITIASAPQESRVVQGHNVAAVIPGSDPDLKGEYLILSAHYDHVGAGPHLRGATPDDDVFNGARDNAMGVVALLAAARELAERPARRSLLLLAFAAEEEGLLGSRHYLRQPLVPLQQTVFVFNVDMAGWSATDLITVIGLERVNVEPVIRSAVEAIGLKLNGGPEQASSFFFRSDNINFARAGIPAPTVTGGLLQLDESTMRYYHQPDDEADEHFDFAYLNRFCQAYVRMVRAVADRPQRPKWAAGDEFEPAAAHLYQSIP